MLKIKPYRVYELSLSGNKTICISIHVDDFTACFVGLTALNIEEYRKIMNHGTCYDIRVRYLHKITCYTIFSAYLGLKDKHIIKQISSRTKASKILKHCRPTGKFDSNCLMCCAVFQNLVQYARHNSITLESIMKWGGDIEKNKFI